jgi:Tol biopolymer transport system component
MITFQLRVLKVIFVCLIPMIVFSGCQIARQPYALVFTANIDGNYEIYRIKDYEKTIERLTFTPDSEEHSLRVSKDGTRILFEIMDNHSPVLLPRRVYLLQPDMQKIETLTEKLNLESLPGAWSPDEQQIAFLVREGKSALMIMDADGSRYMEIPLSISASPQFQFPSPYLDWTLDGQQIFFSAGNYLTQPPLLENVYLVDVENFHLEQITDDTLGQCVKPTRSPISDQVIITCNREQQVTLPSRYMIYVFDNAKPASQKLVRISPKEEESCYDPAWSPDGSEIVYFCKGHATLYLARPDGTNVQEVDLKFMKEISYLSQPVWVPSGREIAFIAGPDSNRSNIYLIDLETKHIREITSTPANYDQLSAHIIMKEP